MYAVFGRYAWADTAFAPQIIIHYQNKTMHKPSTIATLAKIKNDLEDRIPLARIDSVPEYTMDSLPQSFASLEELIDVESKIQFDIQSVEFQINYLKELMQLPQSQEELQRIKSELTSAFSAYRWKNTQVGLLKLTEVKYARKQGKMMVPVDSFDLIQQFQMKLDELASIKSQNNNRFNQIEARINAEKAKRVTQADRIENFRKFCLRCLWAILTNNETVKKECAESISFVGDKVTASDSDWGREP